MKEIMPKYLWTRQQLLSSLTLTRVISQFQFNTKVQQGLNFGFQAYFNLFYSDGLWKLKEEFCTEIYMK
jgi:hypothetical protein